jgi:hypothetical protein
MTLARAPPQNTVIVRPDEQREYPILSYEWDYLKRLVQNISVAEPIHLTSLTFFWGIAITAFFAGLSLPEDTKVLTYPGKLIYYFVGIAAFFIGVSCGLYAYMERNNIQLSKNNAIEYIDNLEKKFCLDTTLKKD